MTQPQEYSKEDLQQMASFFQQQLGQKEASHQHDLFILQREIARLGQELQKYKDAEPANESAPAEDVPDK